MPTVSGWSDEELERRSQSLAALIRRAWRAIARSVSSFVGSRPFITESDVGSIPDEWNAAVEDLILDYVEIVYTDSAGRIIDALDVSTDLAISDDIVAAYLREVRNRLTGIGEDVWLAARDQIIEGVRAGDTIPEVAERVRNVTGVTDGRATRIARTEVHAAHEAGSYAQALAIDPNGTKEWLATEDDRTRPTHRVADGQRVPMTEPFDVGGDTLRYPGDVFGEPQETINCVLGDTIVDAPVMQVAMRSWYVGDLIDINISTGQTLSVTPNHPILTRSGWVLAKNLVCGDDVVCGDISRHLSQHQPNHIPSEISKIYELASVLRSSDRKEFPANFHGERRQCEVYVIPEDGSLSLEIEPASNEEVIQLGFTLANKAVFCESRAESRFLSLGISGRFRENFSSSKVGLECVGSFDFQGSPSLSDVHSGGSVSDCNSRSSQDFVDLSTIGAESNGEALPAFSVNVSLNKIVNLARREYSGHVYNLSTSGGWYTGNSIITGNCRCTALYDLLSEGTTASGLTTEGRNIMTSDRRKAAASRVYSPSLSDGDVIAESSDRSQRLRWGAEQKRFVLETGTVNGTWAETEKLTKKATYQRIRTGNWFTPDEPVVAALTSHTGSMLALVPTEEDARRLAVDGGEPWEDLHVTLGYFGEGALIPEDVREHLLSMVTSVSAEMPQIVGDAFSLNLFNPTSDEPCVVLGMSGGNLEYAHRELMGDVSGIFEDAGMSMHSQHSPWIPHITLKYTDALDGTYATRTGPVTFDKVRLTFGDVVHDISLGAGISDDVWDGVISFDDNGTPLVPNVLIPLEALQERDVNIPGPGHSLRDYWVRGEGAAKIRWGTEGSMSRCIRYLSEYVRDPGGLCAEYHHAATGEWPRGGNVPSESDTVALSDDVVYAESEVSSEEVNVVDMCPPGEHLMPDGECMPDEEMQDASWYGVILVEGIESGDGRMFAPNSVEWDTPPLPLMWEKETSHGGNNSVSVRVGSINRIWREPDPTGRRDVYLIKGEGTIDMGNPDGREVYRRMRRGYMRGTSVDVDSVKGADVQLMYPSDSEPFSDPDLALFTKGRIRATTLVEIPAFTEAQVYLTPATAVVASAIRSHSTATTDEPWDATTMVARLPREESALRECFAWVDSEADPDNKTSYKFPHHMVSADGTVGAANLSACSSGIGVLNGARGGTDIPRSDYDGVYTHLTAHLRDADRTPPAKSFASDTVAFEAVPIHETGWTDEPWDSGVALGRLPSPMTVETAQNVFAWIDETALNEEGLLPQYAGKLPHHEVGEDGTPGAANLTACSSAIAALHGARGGVDIPDDQRRATYNHLAAHLEDAGRTPPEFDATSQAMEDLVAATSVIEVTDTPPREWFEEPTDVVPAGALTVTSDGRIYGYVAPADVRHRSFQDRLVYAPRKKVDYDRFMGGETIVSDGGRVRTGNITMNCGHATTAVNLSASKATEHYDNTCSVVATVRVGENRNGTWFAGALLPDVSPDQIRRIMACRLSGDWRTHLDKPGWREFVAALLVPVPGFPMARTSPSVSVHDGELVASSVPVTFSASERKEAPAKEADNLRVTAAVARIRKTREDRVSALRARVTANVNRTKIEALKARVRGDG